MKNKIHRERHKPTTPTRWGPGQRPAAPHAECPPGVGCWALHSLLCGEQSGDKPILGMCLEDSSSDAPSLFEFYVSRGRAFQMI